MSDEILNALGIEQWRFRPPVASASTILVVTSNHATWSLKMSHFFNQILMSVPFKALDVKFCTALSPDALLSSHICLIWFLGEAVVSMDRPTVVSPSLDVLMENGPIKKEFYRQLCNVTLVSHSSN